MKNFIMIAILISAWITQASLAQNSAAQAGQQRRARGERLRPIGNAGQITGISGQTLTLKNATGMEFVVSVSSETRFRGKDREPIAFEKLKVGDYVRVGGETVSNDIVHAHFVRVLDEDAVRRMQEVQAEMGRTLIAGEIKEILGTQVRVRLPDVNEQVIELDENTSIKRGNESITFHDLRVGDRIFGRGELKNGFFVPSELQVIGPGEEQQWPRDNQPSNESVRK